MCVSKGGVTRQHCFPNKDSAEDILNVMKLPFFPNGSSSLGKLCDMQIRLGNFQQQVLDGNVLTYQTISVKISLPRQGCICYQRKRLAHKELEIYAQKYCLKMMMLMISN